MKEEMFPPAVPNSNCEEIIAGEEALKGFFVPGLAGLRAEAAEERNSTGQNERLLYRDLLKSAVQKQMWCLKARGLVRKFSENCQKAGLENGPLWRADLISFAHPQS